MAGRPRRIEDAVILRALVEVMGRVGPAGLTLAAVAQEVGLVPGTLVQRFGSKRGMLLALAEHSAQDARGHAERAGAEHTSPLDALEALVAETHAPLASPTAFANHLAFLCADLVDPELYRLALAAQQAQTEAVRTLLDRAADSAGLLPGTDTAALTAAVQAAVNGAAMLWAVDREGTLADRQRQALHFTLAPYRKDTPRT
ncbi:TetR/AcrR family transcriptional regulator [Streptomyces sp. NPDC089799]|uniref:TetR/AcrR family transcriptional regulator n=1 Tax=Streptomyces sp. NPDC089799 TaxID=3155066 RepID=UPI00341D183D